MRAPQKRGHDDLLSSWKEIANYLHRGVRTIQRWELELGLPVRRPAGKRRSAVIAMRSELDEWLRACPRELLMVQETPPRRRNGRGRRRTKERGLPVLYEHLNRARVLQGEVFNSVTGLSRSIEQLYATVQRLRGSRPAGADAEELKQQVNRRQVNGEAQQALT